MVNYQKYAVKLQFKGRLIGGIPKNPKVIDAWIDAKVKKENKAELKEETREAIDANAEVEKGWVGFKKDKKGHYIETRQVKAMMKETADTLQLFRGKGSIAKKQTMQHGTFVKSGSDEKIYLLDAKGKPKKKPDGQQERCVHVETFRGKRTALKREDYVLDATLKFEIWVVIPKTRDDPTIPQSDFEDMFGLGEESGLGASRSQEFGKFELKSLKPIK